MATNANNERAKGRMKANSVEKHEYGAKEDESSTGRILAA
jgi:hypothetical protein